eukprot:scaffold97822_cov23-Tisochrysis_lutea.AAC.1
MTARRALALQMEVHYFLRSCESGDLLRLMVQLPTGHAMPIAALAAEPPKHCMPTGFVFAREIQPEILLRTGEPTQTAAPDDAKAHIATKLCMLDAKVYENELGRKKIEDLMISRHRRRTRSASSLPVMPAAEHLATLMCTPSTIGVPRLNDLTLARRPVPNDYVEDGWRSVSAAEHSLSSQSSPLSPRHSTKLQNLALRLATRGEKRCGMQS